MGAWWILLPMKPWFFVSFLIFFTIRDHRVHTHTRSPRAINRASARLEASPRKLHAYIYIYIYICHPVCRFNKKKRVSSLLLTIAGSVIKPLGVQYYSEYDNIRAVFIDVLSDLTIRRCFEVWCQDDRSRWARAPKKEGGGVIILIWKKMLV